jgi:hypothetical protein
MALLDRLIHAQLRKKIKNIRKLCPVHYDCACRQLHLAWYVVEYPESKRAFEKM